VIFLRSKLTRGGNPIKLRISCLTVVFLSLSAATAIASTTWYVNGVSGSSSSDCKTPTTACKTISRAVSLAASGDTIRVAAAIYTESFTLGKSLNISGAGASTTIIDANELRAVVTIPNTAAHVTLSKLTIRNGKAAAAGTFQRGVTSGGGINNSGTLTLTNSTVSGNWAPIPCIHSFVFCEISAGAALGGGINQNAVLLDRKFHQPLVETLSGCHQGLGWSLRRAFSIESSKTISPLSPIEF
jgi:hypothetical protein